MFGPYRRPGRHGFGGDRLPPLVPDTPDDPDPAADSPAPSPAATPAAEPAPAPDSDSDSVYGTARRAMRVLPLGAGFALVGLGLGFLALRMRRN